MSQLARVSGALLWTAALFAPAASWAAAAVPDPTYAELRALALDGRRLPVHGLVLERDVFRFTFEEGTFHFLRPIGGRTVAAVFLGQGSFQLTPATPQERQHLALRTGEERLEVLTDRFDSLVLLFCDDTFEELSLTGAAVPGAVEPRAESAWKHHLTQQRKDFKVNFHLRLLVDLLNTPQLRSGVFVAAFTGAKLPPAAAIVDPLGADALGVEGLLGGEDTALFVGHEHRGGFWYLSHRRGELERHRPTPFKPLADALRDTVDTRVNANETVAATTVLRFRSQVPNLRVLPLDIARKLRIEEVAFARGEGGEGAAWMPAAFVQEAELEDAMPGIVLPEPVAKGEIAAVRLRYAGKEILFDAGEGNFYVGARSSWYPNLGTFNDLATFDLTYRVPAGLEVVSVGRQVGTENEPGFAISRWRSEQPIRVAGFNYGRFKRLDRVDEATGTQIAVYTNPGTPGIVREIAAYLRAGGDLASGGEGGALPGDFDDPSAGFVGYAGPDIGQINTASLAESALVDTMNSARVCRHFFGPLDQNWVAVTQQSEWSFGQSWPSLIFLPYVSFMGGGLRAQLGIRAPEAQFEGLAYHELSHQWWGHQVGWESYRDQWLSEGFAQFTAALVLQHTRGWAVHDELWRLERKQLLERLPGSTLPSWQAGPISLGQRLATDRSPSAYFTTIYVKGGFVLHMLRMAMRDPAAPDPDARFAATMQDFVRTWSGKNPSTADFQATVERHMVPALNATQDGKLDWFFEQWVRGTEIPRFTHTLKAERTGETTRVRGEIRQEGVGPEFRTLVPVYLELDKLAPVRVAMVPMIGSSSRAIDLTVPLDRKTKRVLLNAHYDLLSRD